MKRIKILIITLVLIILGVEVVFAGLEEKYTYKDGKLPNWNAETNASKIKINGSSILSNKNILIGGGYGQSLYNTPSNDPFLKADERTKVTLKRGTAETKDRKRWSFANKKWRLVGENKVKKVFLFNLKTSKLPKILFENLYYYVDPANIFV